MQPTQEQVNDFLEELRQTGQTNMFGATPYVANWFRIDHETARKMLLNWMNSYS